MIKFHPSARQLSDFVEGTLTPAISLMVSAHCDMCEKCQRFVEIETESLAAQIGLLKATRDYDLKRMITFHGRVESAKHFASDLEGARSIVKKRHLPKGTLKADFVSGKMPTHERQDKLRSLRDSGSNDISILKEIIPKISRVWNV